MLYAICRVLQRAVCELFPRNTLLFGHRFESPLAADLTALAPDCRHVLGEIHWRGYTGRRGRFFGRGNLARGDFHCPLGELIRVAWPLSLGDCHGSMLPHPAIYRHIPRGLWKFKMTHYRRFCTRQTPEGIVCVCSRCAWTHVAAKSDDVDAAHVAWFFHCCEETLTYPAGKYAIE
jgi:hypothetical protein